ncbi:hypothetical protein [Aequorivita lipolytica]|uniref:DUF1360 domain-containing protein n=1 Tax=Aequorivita lipolytica TaxID=153267 RepID=A0A5C6YN03_9FLAO|nr:hypothetical protein [Aequorivita lipolytica]TXD68952.1 hypothetical protein ESV24_09360 [Aequorivita lipolytica]SRX53074.1 hypothetical protein AEQU2_02302 [Aequorivita lipolytica]
MQLSEQVTYLFLLALPIACIAWTVTHEELFKEPRDFCLQKSKSCKTLFQRKFYYVFTCEYCFSHYVTLAFLIITRYHLLYADWRGYLIGGFALVWIANVYMSIFDFIRVGKKKEKIEADIEELKLKKVKKKVD